MSEVLEAGSLILRCPPFWVRVGITTGAEGVAGGARSILAGFAGPFDTSLRCDFFGTRSVPFISMLFLAFSLGDVGGEEYW